MGVVGEVGLDEGGEVPHGSTAAFGIWRLKIDLNLPEGKGVGHHERVDGEQGGDLGPVTDFVEEDVPEDFAGLGFDTELSDVQSLEGEG